LADHYLHSHHPIDIKFVGLNAIIIQRKGPESKNFGRDLVTTANRYGWPSVGRGGTSYSKVPLSAHLTSGSPLFSLLEDFCDKKLTFNLPRSKKYEVVILQNKIVYSYRENVFQDYLFAGGGLE